MIACQTNSFLFWHPQIVYYMLTRWMYFMMRTEKVLKIPEDTFYSMLRSKLEQQLADATFEGEDIDEEELRDISGRARFLIRKLYSKGWF